MAKKKQVRAKSAISGKKKVETGKSYIAIPQLRKAFVVVDNFTVGDESLFSYVDDDVATFCGRSVKPRPGYKIVSCMLHEELDDTEARAMLSGAQAIDLAAIRHLISLQPRGGRIGTLSVAGEANVFILAGGRAEVVWDGGTGWGIWVFKGKSQTKWPEGTKWFGRMRA